MGSVNLESIQKGGTFNSNCKRALTTPSHAYNCKYRRIEKGGVYNWSTIDDILYFIDSFNGFYFTGTKRFHAFKEKLKYARKKI